MNNLSFKYGLFGGLTMAIVSMVIYLMDPASLFGPVVYVTILIPVIMLILLAKETRKEIEFPTWKELLNITFAAMVIYSLISTAFDFVLYNLIAPELTDLSKEVTLASLESYQSNLDPEMYEEMVDKLTENDYSMGVKNLSISLAVRIIFGFMLAAIISLIFKKEDPNAWN